MAEFSNWTLEGARTSIVLPCILTIIIVGLRIFVRIKLGNFGGDDLCIALACACFIITIALGNVSVSPAPVTADEHLKIRAFFAAYLIGFLSLILSKVGIFLALLRLLENIKDWRKRFLQANLVLFGILTVLALVQFIAKNCDAGALEQDQSKSPCIMPGPQLPGTCVCVQWDPRIGIVFGALWSVHSAILDLAFSFIAIFTVYKLQLSRKKKVGLYFLFGLGSLAAPFAILRYFGTSALLFGLWTTLEITLVITCASVPMLPPLWDSWRHGKPLKRRTGGAASLPTVPATTFKRKGSGPVRLQYVELDETELYENCADSRTELAVTVPAPDHDR